MGPSGQGAVTPQQLEFSRLALRLGVSLGAVSSRLGTCPGPSETLTPQTGSGHRGLPRAPPPRGPDQHRQCQVPGWRRLSPSLGVAPRQVSRSAEAG